MPTSTVPVSVYCSDRPRREQARDSIAREVPVALVYNGVSHAVMMATPTDLEELGLGFSLSEGILERTGELYDCTVAAAPEGISVEMQIATQRLAGLQRRRRNLTGRTGCGLCGTESLAEVLRPVARVTAPPLSDAAVQRALAVLRAHQPLQAETGASHGAAWCSPEGDILMLREDVGRHNALDKLIGALLRREEDMHTGGFVLVSSRASYEMVQKSCAVGIGALVAVSAPTSLAIDYAQRAGQLLIGFARPGRHVIYHDPLAGSASRRHAP
ncbi:formate dehydrogenase accessory sulfurtransferase FdhD [Kineobactrum salinum]|uniref:Sulfur carrier protein FdhD n=1 Tax=Kineobactrum salinum TaxID=2708301 RepID=A0A6C0TZQ7_9GAMM|nr:formate dehydrogenase accessory sulfurtransferase FdhD [Kineobactrum salinum]QIB65320.1 formate dehydrogenase accessory sulfurtransferase FdhD [Kineobactrum salinum]